MYRLIVLRGAWLLTKILYYLLPVIQVIWKILLYSLAAIILVVVLAIIF